VTPQIARFTCPQTHDFRTRAEITCEIACL
jgi:hypothetical protein